MKSDIKHSRATLKKLLDSIVATDGLGAPFSFEKALEDVISLILTETQLGGKLLFIGNGGSAAIASHMATDFWKNAGIKALAFNDSVLLTCVSNDHGYPYVFEKAIEMFADPKDILVAISSSGKSENILRGTLLAKERGLSVITLSGFEAENPLRQTGGINFYVPVSHYGFVEVIHHSICHCWIDVIIKNKSKLEANAFDTTFEINSFPLPNPPRRGEGRTSTVFP